MKILTLLTLLLASLSINAQQYTDTSDVDKQAQTILQNLHDKYGYASTYALGFDLVLEIPGYPTETAAYQIDKSDESFRVVTEIQTMVANTETVWTYFDDRNEVQIEDAEDGGASMINPMELLSLYQSDEYAYAIQTVEKIAEGTAYNIEFKPLQPTSEYAKLRLTVLGKTNPTLLKAKLFAKDGSRYLVNNIDIDMEATFDAKHFEFDTAAYPDIHIEDLRF